MSIYLLLSITFFLIALLTAKYGRKNIVNTFLNTLMIFIYIVITIIYFSADYFTGNGITKAVLDTLELGLNGAGFGQYTFLISLIILSFVVSVAFSYIYFRVMKQYINPNSKQMKKAIHTIFLFLAFMIHPFNVDLYHLYRQLNTRQSTNFDQYYIKPNLSNMPNQKYNLVYIYAESLENTYFDNNLFPNLVPNLSQLKKESIEFTNINQVTGTGNTIAGMTATQCAIPFFTTSNGNSMNGSDSFLAGATCMGDILKSSGYHLVFMQGSSVEFSGIGKLYKSHHFDEIYGFKKLKKQLSCPTHLNGWGLYDDSLFSLVYKKFETLSKTKKPFALFMATIDTHHPDGMVSPSCQNNLYKEGKNSILNAVHCSDMQIAEFIHKIDSSKYADKTLIVVTSDHLAMKNTAYNLLKQGKRHDLFLIFDPKHKKHLVIDNQGSMIDVGPTLLSKLGIHTDYGLGRNLFSETSLLKKFKNFNKKLFSWRQRIIDFWKFPILGRHIYIDKSKNKIHIGLHSYALPILAKINKDNKISPVFELGSSAKLIVSVAKLKPAQKFIWVDQCDSINYLFDLNMSENMCLYQGSLSSITANARPIEKDYQKIDTSSLLKNIKTDKVIYQKRKEKLNALMVCKQPFSTLNQITIVTSRSPILLGIPSAIATPYFYKQLSQTLNLLTIDPQGKYALKDFDIHSRKQAKKLIDMLSSLIKKKRFWAVIAQYSTNNIFSEKDKEQLKALGFQLLPKLHSNMSYIAYSDNNGTIHELADPFILCHVIQSFVQKKSKK